MSREGKFSDFFPLSSASLRPAPLSLFQDRWKKSPEKMFPRASLSPSYKLSTAKNAGISPYYLVLFSSPPVWSSTLHGCRLCSLCIWLHKHNQYGRGELFYDWRSCCVFGGEIHYLVSEPSAIQYHLFIKSLFARRKWIQLQQRERGRGRGGERGSERREDGERWREIKKGTCVCGKG